MSRRNLSGTGSGFLTCMCAIRKKPVNISVSVPFPVNCLRRQPRKNSLKKFVNLMRMTVWTGILVQLPLPDHIQEDAVIEAISPQKDVDGFHPWSVGALCIGKPGFVSCTACGHYSAFEAQRALTLKVRVRCSRPQQYCGQTHVPPAAS